MMTSHHSSNSSQRLSTAPSSSSSNVTDYSSRDHARQLIFGLIRSLQFELLSGRSVLHKLQQTAQVTGDSRDQRAVSKCEHRLRILEQRAASQSGLVEWSAGISSLKALAQLSEANVKLLLEFLMEKLKSSSWQLRILVVTVCDYLFVRSKVFRQLMMNELETFLSLTVDVSGSLNSSAVKHLKPNTDSTQLKQFTSNALHQWTYKFGALYRPLQLANDFVLKSAAANNQQQTSAPVRTAIMENILCAQIEHWIAELPELQREVNECSTEIENILEILIPDEEQWAQQIQHQVQQTQQTHEPPGRDTEDNHLLSLTPADSELPSFNSSSSLPASISLYPDSDYSSYLDFSELISHDFLDTQQTHDKQLDSTDADTANWSDNKHEQAGTGQQQQQEEEEVLEASHSSSARDSSSTAISGLVSSSYSLEISFDVTQFDLASVDPVLLETLQERIKQLTTVYQPRIKHWVSTVKQVTTQIWITYKSSRSSSTSHSAFSSTAVDAVQDASVRSSQWQRVFSDFKQNISTLHHSILQIHTKCRAVKLAPNNSNCSSNIVGSKSNDGIESVSTSTVPSSLSDLSSSVVSDRSVDRLLHARKAANKRVMHYQRQRTAKKVKS